MNGVKNKLKQGVSNQVAVMSVPPCTDLCERADPHKPIGRVDDCVPARIRPELGKPIMPHRCLPMFWALMAFVILSAGCERAQWDPTLKVGDPQGHIVDVDSLKEGDEGTRTFGAEGGISLGGDSDLPEPAEATKRGTGTFVQRVAPAPTDTTPGDVTLNFDGTDIRDVVKVILGDLLGVNYVLDPGVSGAASLQTGRPLRREHLLPTLETLLRMNSAALVYRNGTYEVVPVANAVQGRLVPQLGESERALPSGYSLQIVPLQYIGAEEMNRILEPLAPEGSVIRVDTLRNLLIVAGTSSEMSNLLDTIRTFDVDWMAGLSVGFFTLEFAKSSDVVAQLETLLADDEGNPFKGLFRFIPVESANSLLVISPQQKYLDQASDWIERLDFAEATGDAAERLFVYRVKHGDAENLADILTQLFSGESSRGESTGRVAPGLRSTRLSSSSSDGGDTQSSASSTPRRAVASSIELSSQVSIVADTINNSLLVKSTPRDYKKILDALKQLDLVPLQVLVEATIVEIQLSGDLSYGVQWLFQARKTYTHQFGQGSLPDTIDDVVGTPGFNWTVINDVGKVRATLSALATDGLVNVLSSPSVMVLDNQEANINVGQRVPVPTTQQQGTSVDDRIINSIEYEQTGVTLNVKPRVTPGGLVQMEVEQEVSTVEEAVSTDTLDAPTFSNRTITSSVAVRSNQAVVLGGLIQDMRSDTNSGIPGLYSLPIVGPLFGERSRRSERTELVVVITPRVVASDEDAQAVTRDFRRRLKGLDSRF